MQVFPKPSLRFIHNGCVVECCVNKNGINHVWVRCSWIEDKDVDCVIGRDGLIFTGWIVLKSKPQRPATKKRYYEEC